MEWTLAPSGGPCKNKLGPNLPLSLFMWSCKQWPGNRRTWMPLLWKVKWASQCTSEWRFWLCPPCLLCRQPYGSWWRIWPPCDMTMVQQELAQFSKAENLLIRYSDEDRRGWRGSELTTMKYDFYVQWYGARSQLDPSHHNCWQKRPHLTHQGQWVEVVVRRSPVGSSVPMVLGMNMSERLVLILITDRYWETPWL